MNLGKDGLCSPVLDFSGAFGLGMVIMNNHARTALQIEKGLSSRSPTILRISLLGRFHLQCGKNALTAEQIHLRKARDLLKLLALAPNHRLHREEVLDLLWSEQSPQQAAHNLSQTLYTLRPKLSTLDTSICLEFEDECLILKTPFGILTDVKDFQQAARSVLNYSGRSTSQAVASCQQAIIAYTGDLLPDDGPSDLFYQHREQLRQMHIDLLLCLAHYNLELKDYLPAIDALQQVIAADPAHEEAHMRLMRAYALNGQRQAALRQYQLLADALRRELDVEPSTESTTIRDQILNGELAAKHSPVLQEWLVRPRHNLPSIVSSFIGRDAEILQLLDLVQSHRLVTLTGAGGVGKTRLAFKVAEGLLEEFQQGVYWVGLASLSNPDLVANAVLDAFHLPEQAGCNVTDLLLNFLRDRDLLLLLDNCEHLLSGCVSLVDLLLNASPSLHILVTSRVRFNLPGEVNFYVPSLASPEDSQSLLLTEIAQYDAVQLFVERSAGYSPGFTLSTTNTPSVVQICQRLDGIPLALELAAARTRMLTVEQIASKLDDVFRLLAGGSQAALPRHRTLQASIEWSYALLSRQEQLILQRFSVFAGGCTLEAAEAVCAGEEIGVIEILDLLSSLVDQSLLYVKQLSEGEARYYLLETIHQFAHQRLLESGAVPMLHKRHLAYFLQLAEEGDRRIRGPLQLIWTKRLEKEKNNFTIAINRAFESSTNVELGVLLVCALDWFWGFIGEFITGERLLRKALVKSELFGRIQTRAKVLFLAGHFLIASDNLLTAEEGMVCLEESLSIWRELGQDYYLEEAKCLFIQGFIQQRYLSEVPGNEELGYQLMSESIKIFQKAGNLWWHAWAVNLTTYYEEKHKDMHAYRELLREEILLWQKTGNPWGAAMPIMDWGHYALKHGLFMEAQEYLIKSLAIFQDLDSAGMIFQILRDLGHIARAFQKYDQAEQYLDQCVKICCELGLDDPVNRTRCARGFIALHRCNQQAAETFFKETLQKAQEMNFMDVVVLCIAGFAGLSFLKDNQEIAIRLFAACNAHWNHDQDIMAPYKVVDIDPFIDRCRKETEPGVFDQAWAEGSALSLDQAIQIAQESLNIIPSDQKMIQK
ncbi:MAG: BTAD domain-containing putative transcriptional regulator [Anaerolineaceae bacterium]|nr:BTAD domain-containing putative transcriptional regulator [Anaerolineaceae bacterium]